MCEVSLLLIVYARQQQQPSRRRHTSNRFSCNLLYISQSNTTTTLRRSSFFAVACQNKVYFSKIFSPVMLCWFCFFFCFFLDFFFLNPLVFQNQFSKVMMLAQEDWDQDGVGQHHQDSPGVNRTALRARSLGTLG